MHTGMESNNEVSGVLPQRTLNKPCRENMMCPGMAARSFLLLAEPSQAILFLFFLIIGASKNYFNICCQKSSKKQLGEASCFRTLPWRVWGFPPCSQGTNPTAPEANVNISMSCQELLQARSYYNVQKRRFFSFLKNQSLRGQLNTVRSNGQRGGGYTGTAQRQQQVRQTSFPPCDGFSEHAETLKHFARPNHQELIQYPFIAL